MRTRHALRCEHLESREVPTLWTMPGWTDASEHQFLHASDVPTGTTEIVIPMGAGDDWVFVFSCPAGVPVRILGGAGNDKVNIGNDLNLTNTKFTWVDTSGTNELRVVDQDSVSGGDHFIVNREVIGLTRLPLFEVRYADSTGSVVFFGTNSNDRFDVTDWTQRSLVMYAFAGDDTFNFITPMPYSGTGASYVQFSGDEGNDHLTVNYSAETAAAAFEISYDGTSYSSATPGPGVVSVSQMIGGATTSSVISSHVEQAAVVGGRGNDEFRMTMTAAIPSRPPIASTINLDGHTGTDTLVAKNLTNAWTLSGANAGRLASTGFVGSTNFSSMENLTGNAGADTLTVANTGAGLSGTFDGGGGSDTVRAATMSNRWELSGRNAGTLNGARLRFVNTESLIGGAKDDTFVLLGTFVGLDGTLDGGAGTDTLDTRLIFPRVPPIGAVRGIERTL